MWEDPIVEEVHAIREQLLARFDGDLHRYCEYVRSLPTPAKAAAAQGVPPSAEPPAPSAGSKPA